MPTSPHHSPVTVLALCLLLPAGCAAPPPPARPTRSLDELYRIADGVNADAEPYGLGIGDSVGATNYVSYVRSTKGK